LSYTRLGEAQGHLNDESRLVNSVEKISNFFKSSFL